MKLNKIITDTLFAAATILVITGCGEQKSKDFLENIKEKELYQRICEDFSSFARK